MNKSIVVDVKGLKLGDGIVKICYPVTSVTKDEILNEVEEVKNKPWDIIEWRVDFYEDAHDKEAVFALLGQIREVIGEDKVLMFVLRTADEGSAKSFDRDYYFDVVNTAIDSGLIDIIDVEYYSGKSKYIEAIQHAADKKVVSIGSVHLYNGTPNSVEIVDTIDMIQGRADIAKMAVMASNKNDTERILEAGKKLMEYKEAKYPSPFILIGMGEAGRETRRTDIYFGSCISYCMGKDSMSPGQIPLEELVEMREKVLNK